MQTPQRSRYSRGGSRGRGRGRNDVKGGPGRTGRLRGLFDGIWHCDCDPRLPAEQFKVKKEGPNKGRDFYTCQQSEPNRCGFFLWAEEARPRETAVVLNNGRTETHRNGEVQEGWSAGRRDKNVRFASPSPSPTPAARTIDHVAGIKRSSHDAGFGGADDDNEYGLTREDEEDIAQVMDTSVFQTPRRPQTSTGVYATPSSEGGEKQRRTPRKLPWLEEPITPVSTRKSISDYFGTPSKQQDIIEETQTQTFTATYPDPPSTPAPKEELAPAEPPSPSPAARFTDSLANSTEDTLTREVFQELSAVQLPKPTIDRLRSILTRHDLRTQGIKMGRDASRAALKTKEAKIIELERRIKSLEEVRGEMPTRKQRRHEVVVHQDEEGEETDEEL